MTRPEQRRSPDTHSRRLRQAGLLAAFGVLLMALVGGVAWWSLDSEKTTDPAATHSAPEVVEIPIAKAAQVAAGIRVDEPAIDRGKLPLDTTVRQVYELVNTGTETVLLGQPTIEVLDGCCPPQPELSQARVAPGERALVAMSMQMHEGMDGPHLFHLTVPVQNGDAEDALHLYFKGDFEG